MLIEKPNILLVGGTGRNVGKTSLVCEIINQFSKKHEIIGLKITNHFHLKETDTFNFEVEQNPLGLKDSSRMLNAGASKVFYIESEADNLAEAYNFFIKKIEPGQLIVCESNGLSEIVNPGVYLLVNRGEKHFEKASAKKAMQKVNALVEMQYKSFDHVLKRLSVQSGAWSWE